MGAMQLSPFAPCRDDTVYAIYAIEAPLPVTVQWPSCRQTLAIVTYPYPPHVTLEFISTADCWEAGCVYELESMEHGRNLVRRGIKSARSQRPRLVLCAARQGRQSEANRRPPQRHPLVIAHRSRA